MMPDLKGELKCIEKDRDAYMDRAFDRIENTMKLGALHWQKTHPNHEVKFVDFMGAFGFIVDDEWIDHRISECWPHYSKERLERVFADLTELWCWYVEVSDLANVCVEFTLPRKS